MAKEYKKFICAKCKYEWVGFAKRPKCPKCGGYRINILEEKKQNEKIEFEELPKEEIENFETLILDDEDEIEEVIYFKCGDCGYNKIEKGDLYCNGCGEALEIDWDEI